MSSTVVAFTLSLFLLALVLRVPIALALGAAGALGLLLLKGYSVAGYTIATVSYTALAQYGMLVIPMFVIMGSFAYHAKLASDGFDLLNRVMGAYRASVAIATVLAAVGFAAVTGSSVATVSALGKGSITEMQRYGYSSKFAAGLIACVGTLGILIPPSVASALYGVVSGVSIGRLLLAGIIPGLVSAVVYILTIIVVVRFFPRFALSGKAHTVKWEQEAGERRPLSVLLFSAALTGLLISIIVGGIFFGIFTATESAAIGALVSGAILVLRFINRPTEAARRFVDACQETTGTVGMLFALIAGGAIFTAFLVSAGVPSSLTRAIIDLNVPPCVVVVLFLVIMIVLGCFIDGFSIILITAPLMHPIILKLGYDGVWFGIMVVKMIEVGLITPPVGLNAFVVSGIMPHIPVGQVFKGLLPFFVSELVIVSLLFAFPEVVLFLPNLMR